MNWCPPEQRKRPIDMVLMSIGGNDVGFGGLVAYAMTESASDCRADRGLDRPSIRFGPQVSRVYLDVLDERMKALKDALHDGFGVEPARVLQTTYEPIQYDETGALCGAQPTLGMDVHPGLQLHRGRAEGDRRSSWASSSAGSNASPARAAAATARQSRDRRVGTGFKLDHRPRAGVHQARHVRARSEARAGRRHQHGDAAPRRRAPTSSSPIRRRRRCPMRATGGCSARPTTRS